MIKFRDAFGKIVEYSNQFALFEYSTNKKEEHLVYIDYTKGNETNVTLSFETYESQLKEYYPIEIDDGSNLTPYTKTFTESGKHKLVIPTGLNEEKIKVIVEFSGDPPYGNIQIALIQSTPRN